MNTKRIGAPAAMLATLLLVVAGCGDDPVEPAGETVQTAPNGDEFNDADVAFATDMIPHHAQALEMVDMTTGRELDPEVAALAEEIRAAQGPEIEQLVDWLTAWEQPIPETTRDHANSEGEGEMEMDMDMPGMMSEDEMSELESAQGPAFEQRWLEMMIEHHTGAIEMAQSEQDEGTFGPAVELAGTIESGQQAEIEKMEPLLGP